MDFFPFYRHPYYYYGTPPRTARQGQRGFTEEKKTGYSYEQSKRDNKIEKEEIQEIRGNKDNETPIFEIFGIKLYFDDVLIIALIFFLYSEGVNDNLLFISLVLLLLS